MCRPLFQAAFIISPSKNFQPTHRKIDRAVENFLVVSQLNSGKNPDARVCFSVWSPVGVHGEREKVPCPPQTDRFIVALLASVLQPCNLIAVNLKPRTDQQSYCPIC